jgi:ABC-2 type transport system ATP-binding protein
MGILRQCPDRASRRWPGNRGPLAVEAAGLMKRFGATRALNGIDLAVPRGTVYGLLGPNGAGKTTAVRILATLIRPDGGTARVLGRDVVSEAAAVRRVTALAGQSASVDQDLTGRENLVFLGLLAGLSRASAKARAAQLLAVFSLEHASGRQVKAYSGGMRRRLDLAASVITRAELYFLDEPTTGLDPASRAQVHEIIRAVVSSGATVLLTTQYLDEADRLADRIAVIDHGRVVAEGTQGELKAAAGSGTLHVLLTDPAQRPDAVRELGRILGTTVRAGAGPAELTTTMPGRPGRTAGDHAAAALAKMSDAGIGIGGFSLGQPSLDEVFLAITGQHRTGQHRTGQARTSDHLTGKAL